MSPLDTMHAVINSLCRCPRPDATGQPIQSPGGRAKGTWGMQGPKSASLPNVVIIRLRPHQLGGSKQRGREVRRGKGEERWGTGAMAMQRLGSREPIRNGVICNEKRERGKKTRVQATGRCRRSGLLHLVHHLAVQLNLAHQALG